MDNKLYKSRTNKFIGGICGGMGEYLSIDATILRLIMVLLTFATSGILAVVYVVLCFIIPYPDEDRPESASYQKVSQTAEKTRINNAKQKKYLGYILIIMGTLMFVNKLLPEKIARFIIPLAALVIGLVLVISALASQNRDEAPKSTGILEGEAAEEDYQEEQANESVYAEEEYMTPAEDETDKEVYEDNPHEQPDEMTPAADSEEQKEVADEEFSEVTEEEAGAEPADNFTYLADTEDVPEEIDETAEESSGDTDDNVIVYFDKGGEL